MRKILLKVAHPELAEQLVDRELAETIGCSYKDNVRWRCERGHEWDAPVGNRIHKGYGCPYCSGRYAIPGETDLATLYPDLAAELVDQSLASTLKPTSHTVVDWRCERGHVYSVAVSHRVAKHSGCPYCSGRRAISGETDLATTRPDLAAQLVDKSLATTLKAGSNKKVEWKCPECGGIWVSSPNTRTNMGSGCPHCAGKTIDVGRNDLATLRPDLACQVVDKSLLPTLHVTSNKVIMWECEHGHRWETSVGNRVQFGHGCPICAAASHSSRMEREFANVVEDMVGEDEVVRNDRATLGGKELDVVVPSANVAFEFDGVFWHSTDADSYDADLGHVDKTVRAARAGIRLIHVWEDDWQFRRAGVMAQVRDALGISVPRRVQEVSAVVCDNVSVARKFVREHSMYDVGKCDVAFALELADGRMVSAILVKMAPDGATIVGHAGLSSVEGSLLRLLSLMEETTGVSLHSVQAVSDDGFDDGCAFSDVGMLRIGVVKPTKMLVGQATSWVRKPWDDSLSIAANMRKVYTSEKTVWAFQEDN